MVIQSSTPLKYFSMLHSRWQFFLTSGIVKQADIQNKRELPEKQRMVQTKKLSKKINKDYIQR